MHSESLATTDNVELALGELARGRPVLVYDADGREEETDLVYASEFVTPQAVAHLRRDAGGLVCTTLSGPVHGALGLPYLSDVLALASEDHPLLGELTRAPVPYEGAGNQKPSFGLTINHRETFTGVTDHDRSLTIRAVADLAGSVNGGPHEPLRRAFVERFKAPGHVILLNAHPRLLAGRQGHTELATALVTMAGLAPSATICEMLDGPDGTARSKRDAIIYAASNGLVFLTGSEVVSAWSKRQSPPAHVGRASA